MTDNYYSPVPMPAFPRDTSKDSHDVLTTLPLVEYSFDRACFDLASQFEMEEFHPDGVLPDYPPDLYPFLSEYSYYKEHRLYDRFSKRLATIFIELLVEEIKEQLECRSEDAAFGPVYFNVPKKISLIKIEPRTTFYRGFDRLTFKVLVTVPHQFLTLLQKLYQRDPNILIKNIRSILISIYWNPNIDHSNPYRFDLKRIDDVKYYKDWLNDTYNVLVHNQKMTPVSDVVYPDIPKKKLTPHDLTNVCANMFVNYFKQTALFGTLSSATGLLFHSVIDSLGIDLHEVLDKATGIYRTELVGVK